jgi:glucose-1-phosphate thymidylyltransferase
MKGVLLAGGTGSRLSPITQVINKHLIPIYDKPMIYYPLTTLILAGTRDITLVSTLDGIASFEKLLKDGSQWGIRLSYKVQEKAEGIAQGIEIALDGSPASGGTLVVLGDNIFFGPGLGRNISDIIDSKKCHIWIQKVNRPQDFGVIELDSLGKPISIVEKPKDFIGNNAITGLYFFPSDLRNKLINKKKSPRGEFEITSILDGYLAEGTLEVNQLVRGVYWLDAGTIENLSQVSEFVKIIQTRQGQLIGSPDEAALRVGNISFEMFEENVSQMSDSTYRGILLDIVM